MTGKALNCLDTAIELLHRDNLWPVAIKPGEKAPIGESWGVTRPTERSIRETFKRFPNAGVGLLLGPEAGIIDIECDDSEGEGSLAKLMGGEIVLTLGWSSARGPHHLFRYDARLAHYGKSIIKLPELPGLEIRIGGDGKQLQSNCPPTIGTDGKPREWNRSRIVADLPEAVFSFLDAALAKAKGKPGIAAPDFTLTVTSAQDAYVTKALDDECQSVALAPDGEQNKTLNDAAFALGQFVGAGVLDRSEVERRLLEAAAGYIQKDGEHVARATIRSGLNAGQNQPRDLSHLEANRNGSHRPSQGAKPNRTGAPSAKPTETQSQALLRIAQPAVLWHTADGHAYATLPVDDHHEHHAVRSPAMRRWLTHAYYTEHGKPPSEEAMRGALSTIEARASIDGPEESAHIRVASLGETYYLDLCDRQWRAVAIRKDGWEIVSRPPVRFRRANGLRPLSVPIRGGSLDLLREHVTVRGDDYLMLVTWLAAALRPRGPYPILALTGEQGSSKSTLARVLRQLCDPHVSPLRSEPREPRDLMISAANSWMVAIDNISALPSWLSDGLCRLATGGGFATRTLYTDTEETYIDAQRPVVLNGIVDYVTRGDLIDRCLFMHLPPIGDEHRRTEDEFWRSFMAASPVILGALLDAMSGAIQRLPDVKPAVLPRMADFALWGQAVCLALGWDPSAFATAYDSNRRDAHEQVLEESPVAEAIKQLVERDREWTGTATELLNALAVIVGEKITQSAQWPKTPRVLSCTLRRLAPTLRMVGLRVKFPDRKNKRRLITIDLPEDGGIFASLASPSSPASNSRGQNGDAKNDPPSPFLTCVTRSSPDSGGKTQGCDASDASDAKIPASSGDPFVLAERLAIQTEKAP